MKRLRYLGKTLKQDATDQKTCSKLVTHFWMQQTGCKRLVQSSLNWVKRNETMKHHLFFYINPFLFRNK